MKRLLFFSTGSIFTAETRSLFQPHVIFASSTYVVCNIYKCENSAHRDSLLITNSVYSFMSKNLLKKIFLFFPEVGLAIILLGLGLITYVVQGVVMLFS